jgi:CobQ-like glutamine amidotransferase family enzyme
MLMVCGLYQLFGNFFKTLDEKMLKGIGILDVETHGTTERLIGNIVTHNETFGDIIGYENHSGQTYLGKSVEPFATVVKGAGNNSSDGHEGARYRNVIGTYLHGSILPKNPKVADFLIRTAVENKGLEFSTDLVDDLLADLARGVARERPR